MSIRDNILSLDLENKRFLGVCSGFARYLDAPVTIVRIIYCVACLVWPTLIVVYFITYWCLKQDLRPGKLKSIVSESKTADHFKNVDYKRPLYRNPDDKKIAGVCSGIAEYLDISVFIVRLLTFLSLFVFGPFSFWAYIVLWVVLQERPANFTYEKAAAEKAEIAKRAPDTRSLHECATMLRATEFRLREVEAFITSKKFSLHCEINRI